MLCRGDCLMHLVKADENGIKKAAEIIKNGGLVAVPTETVYGLAADAFNTNAVKAIYATKGRPGDNPLILHVADKSDLDKLAAELPDYARLLVDAYWPGPLTLVVRKRAELPPWLGSHPDNKVDTVGIRMSAHPAVSLLIKMTQCILAAPSANKAGKPSPTRAEHVVADYQASILKPDLLIDGGAVEVGVESTVVDVTGDTPVILRHGAITTEMLEKTCRLSTVEHTTGESATPSNPRAPGMKYRHYAPKAPMTLLNGTNEEIAAYIATQIVSDVDAYIGVLVSPQVLAIINKNWGMMAVQCDSLYTPMVKFLPMGDQGDLTDTAKNLFANLRKFDELGVDIILAQALPKDGFGAAIMDRMTKAAEGRMINVGVQA
jgi:L-threonylcarbamoyladenylate synthase